jgi:hypothetical protein
MTLVAWLCALAASHRICAQTCQPYWINPAPFDPISTGDPGDMAAFDDGSGPALYALGTLPGQPNYTGARVVRWRGYRWEILDQGLPPLTPTDGSVLEVLDEGHGPRLYAFESYYEATSGFHGIFRVWDGTQWQPTAPGLYDEATNTIPMCSYNDGTGSAIYGLGYGGIKRWDGSQWQVIGNPTNLYTGFKMKSFSAGPLSGVYFVGVFTGIQGVPNTRSIARWDGQQWHALGSGLLGASGDVCIFDAGQGPELYVSGVGNATTLDVIKWDGQQWLPVPFDLNNFVSRMTVFDDGAGPCLVALGSISSVEGQPTHGLAKFDGQHWHPMPGSVLSNPSIRLTVYNEDSRGPSLFTSGLIMVNGLAQFVGCSPRTCYANCDNSTSPPILNVNDFVCFMNRFAAKTAQGYRDPYANCDQDYPDTFTIADFQCFINKFAAGCP